MKQILKVISVFAAMAFLIVLQSAALNMFDKATRGSVIETILNYWAYAVTVLAFVLFFGAIISGFIRRRNC
jgi:hypothetical protein